MNTDIWKRRSDRPAWHPDDCNGECCWYRDLMAALEKSLEPIKGGRGQEESSDK